MNFVKNYLKYAIAALLFVALVSLMGISAINSISDAELRKSSYSRTDFDLLIAAPDKSQVDAIEADASVESVFAYYAYKKSFSADEDVLLLASDDMDDIGISVLTDKTLIDGAYDKNGAMLDKTAADALGVKVGDSVSFTLLGSRFTKRVAAIYMPSSLAIMENGIVAVEWGSDMEKLARPTAYGGAFVDTADKDAALDMLSDYVGEGNVALTYDQYVSLKCGTKIPGQSDDDYNAECLAKYEKYRSDILKTVLAGGGQVTDKEDAYKLVREQLITTEEKTASLVKLTAVAAFILFAVVMIIFTVTNLSNDAIKRDGGMREGSMLVSYVVAEAATATLVAAVSFLVLYLVASGTYFLADCMSVILALSLSVAVALPIAVIAAVVYVKLLYKNNQ